MRAVAVVVLLGVAVRADDDPVPALLVRLESGKPAERAVAMRTLGRLDDARAHAAVLRAQEDGAADVRHEAAIALAKAGKADAATVSILAKSLEDRDWYVRWQAAVALKGIGPKAEAAVPALAAALGGGGTADVSREAALALATIAPKDERTIAALVAAIEGGVGDRAAIFHATGMCGKAAEPAVPALLRVLKDPEAGSREQAFAALRAIAPGTAEVYAGLLDSKDPGVRVFGARGLGGVRSEETFVLLARALRDREPAVRAAAADAATEMGKFAWKALPDLVPLLADESEHVRIAASAAMTSAGAPELALALWAEWDDTLGRPVAPKRWRARRLWGPSLLLGWAEDPEAIFRTLSDKDVGEGILRAFSRMGFASEQASVEACLRKGRLASRRCAALVLPYIAGDRARAARALRKASEELPDLKDLAEAGLRELEK